MASWGSFPPIIIDSDSPIARYTQLAMAIETLIQSGELAPNSRLPSENELYELLNLSRSTIRKALQELEDKNMVYRRQGQGSFVAEKSKGQVSSSPYLTSLPKTSLAKTRGLLGLLLPSMSNEIYPLIVRGVEDVASQKGWTVFIGNTYANRERESVLLEQMMERDVDGLILEPTHATYDKPGTKTFQLLSSWKKPCVLIDNNVPGFNFSTVFVDDVEGGRIATAHLISKGHRRIAYIYKESVLAAIDRLAGYESALAKAEIGTDSGFLRPYTEEQESLYPGYFLTKELLQMSKPPTAIFYFNDEIAFQGLRAIRDLGLTAGKDVSVVGFDNVPSASNPDIQLTSIEHPKYLVGRWAADILFEQIQGGNKTIHRQLVIKPELIERKTVVQI